MNWLESSLGELVIRDGGVVQIGPFGSQLHESDYVPDGVPVVMPKDIEDGRIRRSTVACVSQETADRLSRHQLKARSVVLPRRGDISKRAYVTAEQEGWLCGTGCVKIEIGGKLLDPLFLYYYLAQDHVVRWLEQHAVGTTMLNLNTEIVSALPVRYPDIAEQRRIAGTLVCYDRLIENNRRRMALLEEAARQVYREWFVRLRFPGARPFRKGGLPDGWVKATASDAMEILSGGTPKTDVPDFWDGDIPFYTPTDAGEVNVHAAGD